MDWHTLISILAALWAGFVLAISFMESWLKFRAAGVTLTTGLSIGQLVFRALNRTEWVILALTWSCLFMRGFSDLRHVLLVSALSILLALQTFAVLPSLSRRAQIVIAGGKVAKSRAHLYYVVAEVIKVGLLATLALSAV